MATRSTTNSLPARPPAVLNRTEIENKLELVHPGQRVVLHYFRLPSAAVETGVGFCVRRAGKAVTFKIPVLDDDEAITLPVPQGDERHIDLQVVDIEVQQLHRIPIKPINKCNDVAPPTDAVAVIYVDGGSHLTSGGGAAAAISVFIIEDGVIVRKDFGRYYPGATNNCTEGSAILAGIRYAEKNVPVGKVTLVCDSKLWYDFYTHNSKITDSKLKIIAELIRGVITPSLVNRLCVCHMLREHGNFADEICNQVMARGRSIEDELDLFCDVPFVHPNKTRAQRVLQPIVTPELPQPIALETIEHFAKLRHFKVRSTVPPEAEMLWSNIVNRSAQAVVSAADQVTRDRAIIELFLLPIRYLPANARTSRIVAHLKAGTPFQLNESKQAQHVRDDVGDQEMHRLKEAMHRLARDGKLRTANKLLRNQATNGDIPHAQKVEMLRQKLVAKDDADNDSPQGADTFPVKEVSLISGNELRNSLKRINRQSATSVEGWSKDHFTAALRGGNSGLDDLLGQILTIISSQHLSPLLLDILRCARLVGIPKEELSGIRPIAIANLWMKLLGTTGMARDGAKPSKHQYAIGHKNGCLKVIHQVRKKLEELMEEHPDEDWVAVKIDISNAFNALMRRAVRGTLEGHDDLIQQYFRLAYGGASPLVVYGPGTFEILRMEEGIRQGDSTSTYLFCLGVDQALIKIAELGPCWMFCDDLTLIVKKCDIDSVLEKVAKEFEAIGLKVNPAKLDIYSPTDVRTKPFVLLGADVAVTKEFNEKQMRKQDQYFRLLNRAPIHPQLKATLLRLCGAPRLQYICSAMPPESTEELAAAFDKHTISTLANILQVEEEQLANTGLLHDVMGAGIPHYTSLREELYAAARNQAIYGVENRVELVTKGENSHHPTARHNLDAQWLWYDGSMTPAEFCAAFGIRIGILQPHLRLHPCKCDCGTVVNNDMQQIVHTINCDRFTTMTHTRRHNAVQHEICRVAMAFGISAVKEPTCYDYNTVSKKRPDILFACLRPLVTDLTIVKPLDEPGNAARIADDEKRLQHSAAVEHCQHVFIPAACEAYGLMGKGLVKLIDVLAKDLPISSQFIFRRTLKNAISSALARTRAAALYGTRHRRDQILTC